MARVFVLGVVFLHLVFHYGWNSPVAIGPPEGPFNFLVFAASLLFIAFSKYPRRKTKADPFFWLFVVAMLVALLVGLAADYPFANVRLEVGYLVLYSSFLVVTKNEERPLELIKATFFALAAASFLVAGEFLWIVAKFGVQRVLSRQQTILAGVIIGATAYFFLVKKSSRWEKLFLAGALVASSLTVLMGVQRTTILGILAAYPLLVTLLWLRGWLSPRGYAASLLIFVLAGAAAVAAIYFSPYRWFLEVALQRIELASQGLANTSVKVRLIDIDQALRLWVRQPVFGQGIGCPLWLWWAKTTSFILDNVYVAYLWKTGLFGFASFFAFYLWGFFAALRGFWRAREPERAFVYFSALALLSFQFIVGLTTANLYIYRFNFLWGALIGALALAEGPPQGAPAPLQEG